MGPPPRSRRAAGRARPHHRREPGREWWSAGKSALGMRWWRVERYLGCNHPRGPMVNDPGSGSEENPLLVLVSGILLMGLIALFISWGLRHAYATPG